MLDVNLFFVLVMNSTKSHGILVITSTCRVVRPLKAKSHIQDGAADTGYLNTGLLMTYITAQMHI